MTVYLIFLLIWSCNYTDDNKYSISCFGLYLHTTVQLSIAKQMRDILVSTTRYKEKWATTKSNRTH